MTRSDLVYSFSGAHAFRPQCLVAALKAFPEAYGITDHIGEAELLTEFVDSGKCPRCQGEMEKSLPAGSRVTDCRCIPVCWACGNDEAYVENLQDIDPEDEMGLHDGIGLWAWPLTAGDGWWGRNIKRRAEWFEAHSSPASLVITDDGAKLLSSDGVGDVYVKRPSGWAKFGFDDTDDIAENES